MRLSRLSTGVLIGVRVLAVILITLKAGPAAKQGNGLGIDTTLYHRLATSAGTPYRDFDVEFPPVTLGELEVVHGSTPQETAVHLAWTQLGFDLLTLLALALIWGASTLGAYLLLTTPFVPFMYLQVDPFVVALVVFALGILELGWEKAGGVLLAVATFAKLWPVVLIPIVASRGKWRSARYAVGTGALGVAAWMWWTGIQGPIRFFRFLSLTGWEIGSVVGMILHFVTNEPIRFAAGTNRIGTVPTWSSLALLAVIIASSVGAAALSRRPGAWTLAAFVSVSILILLSPIFSPQYVLWLIPFAAISDDRRLHVMTGIAVLANAVAFSFFNGSRMGLTLGPVLILKNVSVLVALIYAARLLIREFQARRGPELADETVSG